MKLLIVEDNRGLVTNLFEYFEERGHALDAAPDGVTGLHLALSNHYDAIVLDWMLPRMEGVEMARRFRESSGRTTPIIMLTARDELPDKLIGFGAGVDDYLTKPFAIAELEVRLASLISRSGARATPRVLVVEDLQLDLTTLITTRAGNPLKLFRSGRKLLEALMRASPAVVSREQLEHVLWGDESPEGDLLRSHLYDLRRAVDGPFKRKLIHTISREGYRIGSASD